MPEPTLIQLDAGFKAARALADTSALYGHLITDGEVRNFVAVILQAALEAADAKGVKK
jgi:hypothetical protein